MNDDHRSLEKKEVEVETFINNARQSVFELNNKSSCRENALAITKLDEALMWFKAGAKREK